MSLLDTIKELIFGKMEKRVEKSARLVKNPKVMREDRVAALDFLGDCKDASLAVPALLPRFEYSLEHGINDAREKEIAMEGILSHGKESIPLVKDHLKVTTRIAWPIKILKNLCNDEEMVDILVNCLDFGEVSFDQGLVDKNYDILCYLSDYKIESMADKIKHFLHDSDERVRFAATEVLAALQSEKIKDWLEPFLLDQTAENRRLRATVVNAFVEKKWAVKDPKVFGDAPIVDGVVVNKQGVLERRS